MYKEKYNSYLLCVVMIATLYFIFFQHLDSFHLRDWDESMFAVNAYEMNHNHNFMVPYYKGLPDMWNSKPPLQLWLQVFFIKLNGFNELSVRLPSALASSFSALLLFFFFKKRAPLTFALCTFFVFVSCGGVSTFHTGRTGDSDALLSFFILCSCIELYKWLFENKDISIFYFFIFLTLAFLTKSVAALLFLPAIIFIIFYLKKADSLFKSKWFYAGFIIFLATAIGYFLEREWGNNGYINYVLHNDVGRIHTVIESHKEPFDFYFNNLFEYRFLWITLAMPGAVAMWMNSSTKAYAICLISLFVSYFIIVTYSETKLEWYDLPLFPILSIFSAFIVHLFITKINVSQKSIYMLLFFIFIVPVYFACRSSYKSEIKPEDKKLEALSEYAFQHVNNGSLNKTVFLIKGYDRAVYFYKYKLNEKGFDFEITSSTNNLRPNSVVILADDSLKKELLSKYNISVLDSVQSAWKIEVKSLK